MFLAFNVEIYKSFNFYYFYYFSYNRSNICLASYREKKKKKKVLLDNRVQDKNNE